MEFLRTRRAVEDRSQPIQMKDEHESQRLAQKGGFVSLRDRLNNFTEQVRSRKEAHRLKKVGPRGEQVARLDNLGTKQFATLQELFSTRPGANQDLVQSSSYGNNCQQQDGHRRYDPKKPKIPIMKLSKEDWNVKCWEDRLKSHMRRQEAAACGKGLAVDRFEKNSSRFTREKPAEQVKVFRGRIEEVATKLERVCEGAPADEKLYELTMNKGWRGDSRVVGSHEWTDLLKSELAKGTHNPKRLRAELAAVGSQPSDSSCGPVPLKSPLGRPIRRLFQDEEEEEKDEEEEEEDDKQTNEQQDDNHK